MIPKLSRASLENLLIAIVNLRDERDRPLLIRPQDVLRDDVIAQHVRDGTRAAVGHALDA